MRQYLIVSWIHLILPVITFALAAPLVIRERHEVRVNVVDVAKDRIAASQILSRWDPRDTGSGSDEPPGPESSESSDPEPGPNSPWSETGSETGSNQNSPSRPSSPISSTASPPGLGGGMAPHDAIADGGQILLPAEANPPSGSTSPDHALPQWLLDDLPSHPLSPSTPPTLLWMDPYLSAPSTVSGSTGSGSAGSDSTSSGSTSSGSTSSDSTSSGSTGSGSTTGSDDALPESETFLSKLLNGKIKARTSGSRTVNAAQGELQGYS